MRIVTNAKTLINLYKDYRTMTKEELAKFYQSKCDYYQDYVGISLLFGALFSTTYLYSDYLLNGSYAPTLIPRLSVLVALAVFLIITELFSGSKVTIFMDFALAHYIVIATIWAIYFLDIRLHASEGFIIMNLIFLTVGFVAKPHQTMLSSLFFLLEILVSNSFNHYENLDIIISLEIPCAFAVISSQALLTLFYLDHYRMQQKVDLALVTDPLTQVYNRHMLEKIVEDDVLTGVKEPVSLAMLDIDYFKQVNDKHGHYTGDLTLLYIGQKLSRQTTGSGNYVIRYGGEEFIVILSDCDVVGAYSRMETLRKSIETATDAPVPFTVSVGVSRYVGGFNNSLQNVDSALYSAKNSGRNRVVVL